MRFDRGHVMRDEEIVLPSAWTAGKEVEAFLLEGGVADREDLVDQQDIGVDWVISENPSRTSIPDE